MELPIFPVYRWVRRNLFRNPIDGLLTLAGLGLVLLLGVPLAQWIFAAAEWRVILANRHLLLVGPYPAEELWRVWAIFLLLLALAGLTLGVFSRWGRRSWSVAGLALFMILLAGGFDFYTGAKPWGPASALAAGWGLWVGGYLLARGFPMIAKGLIPGWGLFAVATLVLLSGFEGSAWLPAVSTNRWGGFLLTALLTAVGIVASFPLGVVLALGRRSRLPVIRWFCIGYIELVRGVPLITVLFMGQLLIPLFLPPEWVVDNLIRVMIAVTGFSAAYMAENVRGGLQSVPHGQIEAAQALGLGVTLITFTIVLPQALRNVIPAIVGQCIALFKDTSLVTIIGLIDFLSAGQASFAQAEFAGREAEVYLFIAAVYWLFSFTFSRFSVRLERRLGVGER